MRIKHLCVLIHIRKKGEVGTVCSNDVPRLTLTYLTSRSNLLPNAFKLEKIYNVFLNTVKAKVNIFT